MTLSSSSYVAAYSKLNIKDYVVSTERGLTILEFLAWNTVSAFNEFIRV